MLTFYLIPGNQPNSEMAAHWPWYLYSYMYMFCGWLWDSTLLNFLKSIHKNVC